MSTCNKVHFETTSCAVNIVNSTWCQEWSKTSSVTLGERIMATGNENLVAPPEKFSFDCPESWSKWIRRFERYRVVSGLDKKADELQVNTLVYAMGDEAEDILTGIVFDQEGDEKKYDKVKEKFDCHFIVRRNVIFERAKFNMRVQSETEPVESFITDLHCLAKYCEYGELCSQMIRDRLVVGLKTSS